MPAQSEKRDREAECAIRRILALHDELGEVGPYASHYDPTGAVSPAQIARRNQRSESPVLPSSRQRREPDEADAEVLLLLLGPDLLADVL